MFGGLKKSASRLAIVAAAGVLSTGAYAADLGGDCCADLEERVAELEATTARKGNRKVSLQVWGAVNKTILNWNDGVQKNTYMGIDNTNYATRFGFRGDAKVSPSVKAGYSIMIDINSGATSAQVNASREEASAGTAVNPGCSAVVATGATTAQAAGCGVTGWNNDHSMRMRDANVWLESSSVGRATLGRLTGAGPQGTIDLGGIGNVASGSQSLVGGSFGFRPSAAIATPGGGTRTLAQVTDNLADYNQRVDGIKYDSPTFAGFVFGASIGEALKVDRTGLPGAITAGNGYNGGGSLGYLYALNLRYAGEFSGVRVAAAAGYELARGEETNGASGCAGPTGPGVLTNGAAGACTTFRPDGKNTGLSLSAMHAATGLFAQGHWNKFDRGNDSGTTDTSKQWLVQAGISQNFFGFGKTAVYGEYSKAKNGWNTFGLQNGTAVTAAGAVGGTTAAEIQTNSQYKMWGLGVTQDIDAAAMQLYAGYRVHSLSDANAIAATYGDIKLLMAGARINF